MIIATQLDQQCINTIRFLSLDMVQKANSGHPGLPPSVDERLAVELGVPQGWERYLCAWGNMLGMQRFCASAPAAAVLREYGFTMDNVCERAKALLT